MTKLLTQQDLAERWQVDVTTITNWRKNKIITPCKGIPAIRFTEQYIMELEGIKLDKLSPLERQRLERENEQLKLQNQKMNGIIARITAEVMQIYAEER